MVDSEFLAFGLVLCELLNTFPIGFMCVHAHAYTHTHWCVHRSTGFRMSMCRLMDYPVIIVFYCFFCSLADFNDLVSNIFRIITRD